MLQGRAADPDDWMKKSRGMIDTAHAVLAAVEAKDVSGLFTAGGDLYEACTNCHAKYLIGKEAKQ
jgi:cytochrome c556